MSWNGILPDGSKAAPGDYMAQTQLKNFWSEESESSVFALHIFGSEVERSENTLDLSMLVVEEAAAWPWSSAQAHLAATDDGLVTVAPLLELAGDWRLFLAGSGEEEQLAAIRKHERTGRPLGSEGFVDRLESMLERPLERGKPGPKGN